MNEYYRYYLVNMISIINIGSFYFNLALGFLFVKYCKPKMSKQTCLILLMFELFFTTFIIIGFCHTGTYNWVSYFAWTSISFLGLLHGVVATHFETVKPHLS